MVEMKPPPFLLDSLANCHDSTVPTIPAGAKWFFIGKQFDHSICSLSVLCCNNSVEAKRTSYRYGFDAAADYEFFWTGQCPDCLTLYWASSEDREQRLQRFTEEELKILAPEPKPELLRSHRLEVARLALPVGSIRSTPFVDDLSLWRVAGIHDLGILGAATGHESRPVHRAMARPQVMRIDYRNSGPLDHPMPRCIVTDLDTGKRITPIVLADDQTGEVILLPRVDGRFVIGENGRVQSVNIKARIKIELLDLW